MKRLTQIFILILFVVSVKHSNSQEFTFNDFVGTWHGTISSETFQGYNDPITLTIESNGFYTETSGHLMPTIYPNTQQCDFDVPTNRFHWWYLDLVYAGQYFYQHFFYEIVYFNNDTLEMHYNFWDDPEPHPTVGTIFIVRENQTPPPAALSFEVTYDGVILEWDEPTNGGGSISNIEGYNIYSKFAEGTFELIANTEEEMYVLEDGNAAGLHSYYVTAIYEEGESNPSNQVEITFTTPAPTSLAGAVNGNSVELSWTEPNGGLNPMADLMGYNIYHKEESGTFEMLDFVEMPEFMHEDITTYGTHSYYVIAVFEGGESNPSNIVDVQLVISGIEEELSNTTAVYPNPASDLVNIQSEYEMKSVKIFNQSGQVLKVQQLNSKNQQINITDIPAGLYVFVINTEQGTISKRIFIQ